MTKTLRAFMRSGMNRVVAGAIGGVVLLSLLAGAGSLTGKKAGLINAQAQGSRSEMREPPFPRPFRCSNGTIKGRYATRGDGFVPGGPPPAPLVPFAAVSLMTLDGAGNLSNAVTTSTNGVISSNIDPGSYAVDSDCTGRMTIMIPVPPFQLNFNLVVADKGTEFVLISTTPSVVTVAGKRVDGEQTGVE